jgi:hypothetical protein
MGKTPDKRDYINLLLASISSSHYHAIPAINVNTCGTLKLND